MNLEEAKAAKKAVDNLHRDLLMSSQLTTVRFNFLERIHSTLTEIVDSLIDPEPEKEEAIRAMEAGARISHPSYLVYFDDISLRYSIYDSSFTAAYPEAPKEEETEARKWLRESVAKDANKKPEPIELGEALELAIIKVFADPTLGNMQEHDRLLLARMLELVGER